MTRFSVTGEDVISLPVTDRRTDQERVHRLKEEGAGFGGGDKRGDMWIEPGGYEADEESPVSFVAAFQAWGVIEIRVVGN